MLAGAHERAQGEVLFIELERAEGLGLLDVADEEGTLTRLSWEDTEKRKRDASPLRELAPGRYRVVVETPASPFLSFA